MFIDILLSFVFCGLVCLIAQIIVDNSKLTPGHVTSLFVTIGVILEFFDLYKYLRMFGKVGASIPISNFGALMMSGVKTCVQQQGILGVFTGVFYNTGGAITFAVFLSLIISFFCRPRS